MKIRYLTSASVLIEHEDVKILCDPWLVDGAYYGSWCHFPPYDFNPEFFDDVDYIYLSHIHPDHANPKTLEKLNKKIPIFIQNYATNYLKQKLERLGFQVRELSHNTPEKLKNNLSINILAADNCNPELCFKYFGCSVVENNIGSTSIDTMVAIDNGNEVIVNTNDCPFELAQTSASLIKKQYDKIDLLLVGYTSASAFPQCFDMPIEQKQLAQIQLKKTFVQYAEQYVNLFKPKFFMPFAGRYTLAGKLANLNSQKGVYELEEAYDYFSSSQNINHTETQCILLNSKSTFDITTSSSSTKYNRTSMNEKNQYIENVLSKKKFDYEFDDIPNIEFFSSIIPKCYEKYEQKRKEVNFSSDTVVLIELVDDKIAVISCNGNGFKILSNVDIPQFSKFIKMSLDPRLLVRLLKGPKFAIWNNAEIGSHIIYKRNPEIYERALFYCMSFFHS